MNFENRYPPLGLFNFNKKACTKFVSTLDGNKIEFLPGKTEGSIEGITGLKKNRLFRIDRPKELTDLLQTGDNFIQAHQWAQQPDEHPGFVAALILTKRFQPSNDVFRHI